MREHMSPPIIAALDQATAAYSLTIDRLVAVFRHNQQTFTTTEIIAAMTLELALQFEQFPAEDRTAKELDLVVVAISRLAERTP